MLIDGEFHGHPAVWQREILDALAEGVAVHGSSSMGALRAAELHSFGMIGHGRIFEWYRDGVIDADDEVALTLRAGGAGLPTLVGTAREHPRHLGGGGPVGNFR